MSDVDFQEEEIDFGPIQQRADEAGTGGVPLMLGQKFIDTLFAPARHKALYGGRGSAKSWSVASYLPLRGSRQRKRIVCARQFQNSIRDSSKELIEKRIWSLGLGPQHDVTDRTIVNKRTGSEFIFVGLERNVDSIRSLEGADIVWIDEARTISKKSMEVLLPTIRSPESELIWSWNPEFPDDPVDQYFRGKDGPPPRSIVTFVDYTDNPFFYQTEMPQEMETLKRGNPERYKHVWLGEYDTQHSGKIFQNVVIGRMPVPESVPPRYGMDFGFGKDPSFLVKVYVVESQKRVYIADTRSGKFPLDLLPGMIRTLVPDGELIKGDSSQPQTIEFLQARGINIQGARKGPGSVKSGILYLQGYQIWINPDCEDMREEARLYSWMTDRMTGAPLSVPVDANNHGWDGVRYAVEDLVITSDLADSDDGGVIMLSMWKKRKRSNR